jgi:hypothetical protein
MTAVNADPAALERLKTALEAFEDRQTRALQDIDRYSDETLGHLGAALASAEREVSRCQARLEACIALAALAGAAGGPADCGGPEYELEQARQQRDHIKRALDDATQACRLFKGNEDSYRSYLPSATSAMKAGLEARITNLERYQSWSIGAGSGPVSSPSLGDSSSGSGSSAPRSAGSSSEADEHVRGLTSRGSRGPRPPIEEQEGGMGGPEQGG